MRIQESGIDRTPDTPTTSDASTVQNPTPAPPVRATTSTSVGDTDTADFSCPHCPRTFTSRIGLVGHSRIHRTETGEPVPGAPTYTHQARLNCPHCPRTFRHRMGLFGHMRIHDDLSWALLSGHTPGNRLDRRAKPAYRGLRRMDGRMKHCAGIVETRLCLVRRWITAAGTGLCIAFAETRPPPPTETADSRHMRSFSTTNIKVVAP
nr:unnamed protein product [Spirometra erinaceieuropaei]